MVNALRVIAPELPFEIKFIEITKPEEVLELNGYRITAFRVNHNVTCYGYTLEILRQGKFSPDSAREHEIPLKFWNPLQKGQTVEDEGRSTHRIWFLAAKKRDQAYLYHRYQTDRVYFT